MNLRPLWSYCLFYTNAVTHCRQSQALRTDRNALPNGSVCKRYEPRERLYMCFIVICPNLVAFQTITTN